MTTPSKSASKTYTVKRNIPATVIVSLIVALSVAKFIFGRYALRVPFVASFMEKVEGKCIKFRSCIIQDMLSLNISIYLPALLCVPQGNVVFAIFAMINAILMGGYSLFLHKFEKIGQYAYLIIYSVAALIFSVGFLLPNESAFFHDYCCPLTYESCDTDEEERAGAEGSHQEEQITVKRNWSVTIAWFTAMLGTLAYFLLSLIIICRVPKNSDHTIEGKIHRHGHLVFSGVLIFFGIHLSILGIPNYGVSSYIFQALLHGCLLVILSKFLCGALSENSAAILVAKGIIPLAEWDQRILILALLLSAVQTVLMCIPPLQPSIRPLYHENASPNQFNTAIGGDLNEGVSSQ